VALPGESDFDFEAMQAAWETLEARPLDRNFRGALAQFAKFMAD